MVSSIKEEEEKQILLDKTKAEYNQQFEYEYKEFKKTKSHKLKYYLQREWRTYTAFLSNKNLGLFSKCTEELLHNFPQYNNRFW